MSSMPYPTYDPPPYTYGNSSFEHLPFPAQKFLTERGLAPSWEYNAEIVEDHRAERTDRLFRSLEGVHIALVQQHQMLVALSKQTNGELSEELEQREAEIEHIVGNVLMPERRSHLDVFMAEFDALIWLDVVAREGTPNAPSPPVQEEYRHLKCTPVLKYAADALVALDEAVERELAERAESRKARRPRRHTSGSFAPLPREVDPFSSPPRNRIHGDKSFDSPPHGGAKSTRSLGRASASWVVVCHTGLL